MSLQDPQSAAMVADNDRYPMEASPAVEVRDALDRLATTAAAVVDRWDAGTDLVGLARPIDALEAALRLARAALAKAEGREG